MSSSRLGSLKKHFVLLLFMPYLHGDAWWELDWETGFFGSQPSEPPDFAKVSFLLPSSWVLSPGVRCQVGAEGLTSWSFLDSVSFYHFCHTFPACLSGWVQTGLSVCAGTSPWYRDRRGLGTGTGVWEVFMGLWQLERFESLWQMFAVPVTSLMLETKPLTLPDQSPQSWLTARRRFLPQKPCTACGQESRSKERMWAKWGQC